MTKERANESKPGQTIAPTDAGPTIEVDRDQVQWGSGRSIKSDRIVRVGNPSKSGATKSGSQGSRTSEEIDTTTSRGRPPNEDWRNYRFKPDPNYVTPEAFNVLAREIFGEDFSEEGGELHGLPKPAEPVIRRTVRMASSLFDAMKGEARLTGLSLEEWMRRQFINGLAKGQVAPPPTGASPAVSRRFAGLSTSEKSPKKQVALRLEDELLAAVDEAVSSSGALKNDWLRAAIIKALDEGLDVRAILESSAQDQV